MKKPPPGTVGSGLNLSCPETCSKKKKKKKDFQKSNKNCQNAVFYSVFGL